MYYTYLYIYICVYIYIFTHIFPMKYVKFGAARNQGTTTVRVSQSFDRFDRIPPKLVAFLHGPY